MNTHSSPDHRGFKLFRHPVLAAVLPAVLLIATACSSSPSASTPPTPEGEWPQANHDFANTRAVSEDRKSTRLNSSHRL